MDRVHGGALGEEALLRLKFSFVFEKLPSPYDQKITPDISLLRGLLEPGPLVTAQCQRSSPLGERRFNSV